MSEFIRPSGPTTARIMIVGEYPGDSELARGMPFVGMAGQELDRMLKDAGVYRSACFVTNVVRERVLGGDIDNLIAKNKSSVTPQHIEFQGKHCLKPVIDGISLLRQEIDTIQPNVIIALGNLALWALTGQSGITSWRGSEMECSLQLATQRPVKVIPTYHPAMVFRQWVWRPVMIQDLRRAGRESHSPLITRRDYKFIIRPDYGTTTAVLHQILSRVYKAPLKIAIDIETRAGHIACIGLAWSELEAMCIPLMTVSRDSGYWAEDEEVEILHLLQLILTHRNCQGVGQNFLYDAQYFLRHLHYTPNLQSDTMLAQHSCFSSMQKSLAFLASMYCEHYTYWKDEGKEWAKDVNEDQLWTYNCKDCVYTYEVDTVEQRNIVAMKLQDVNAFQQSLFAPVLRTMDKGIRVDTQRRANFAMELMDEIAKREQWFIDELGHPINPKSPKQMSELFYQSLGQKPVFNRKSGSVSCDDESLRKVAEKEPLLQPLVNKISEHRSLNVFLSTFVNAPLDTDGRMRCSFNPAGTETYRFSSSQNAFGSGLNLQNIPKGGEAGEGLELPNVRDLFIPDPGYTFFDIDLDSADLRIVAWEAGLSEMKAMIAEGKKVYIEVMKEYYKDPSKNKDSKEYRMFKGLCHGTHYLGTAKGLAERLGLLVHEVDVLQKWYYGKFPGLKRWQDGVKDQVSKRHMVTNIFGYRNYIFDRIEGTVFNQAIAWIPQSTVGILINKAYVNIHNNLPHVDVLLQVHDSLAGQFPSHLGDACVRDIIQQANIVLPYDDPTVIPVGCKTSDKSWGACG